MYIILRLVCENFSRINVKISSLWDPKHGVYAAASFSANVTSECSRSETRILTSVILFMNIIYVAQLLFVDYSEILHYSYVFVRHQKLFKPESIFRSTRVNIFTAKI